MLPTFIFFVSVKKICAFAFLVCSRSFENVTSARRTPEVAIHIIKFSSRTLFRTQGLSVIRLSISSTNFRKKKTIENRKKTKRKLDDSLPPSWVCIFHLTATDVLVVSITALLNYTIYKFFCRAQKTSWVTRTSQDPQGGSKMGGREDKKHWLEERGSP